MLVFMTKRNVNGHRKFLNVDVENKTLNYQDLYYIPPENAIEVTATAYRKLISNFKDLGFTDLIKIGF